MCLLTAMAEAVCNTSAGLRTFTSDLPLPVWGLAACFKNSSQAAAGPSRIFRQDENSDCESAISCGESVRHLNRLPIVGVNLESNSAQGTFDLSVCQDQNPM